MHTVTICLRMPSNKQYFLNTKYDISATFFQQEYCLPSRIFASKSHFTLDYLPIQGSYFVSFSR